MRSFWKSGLQIVAACVVGVAINVSCWAGSPWAGEVGEAKDVQRTAGYISCRLNEAYPFRPATQYAQLLETLTSQLLCQIRDGASWEQVQAAIQATCGAFQHLQELAFADHCIRLDERLHGYFRDFERRFARLDRELKERYTELLRRGCAAPYPYPQPAPYYGNQYHVGRPPIDRYQPIPFESYHIRQEWNNPWGNEIRIQRVPQNVIPQRYQARPDYYPQGYPYEGSRESQVGRQVLSVVLREIANRL